MDVSHVCARFRALCRLCSVVVDGPEMHLPSSYLASSTIIIEWMYCSKLID